MSPRRAFWVSLLFPLFLFAAIFCLTNDAAAIGPLGVSPTRVGFGNVRLGASSTKTLTLSNNSNKSLTILQAAVSGGGFATSGPSLPLTLSAGQTSTFNVIFTPTLPGPCTGSVTVTDDASDNQVVNLSGAGTAPIASLSPGSLYFESQAVGTTSSAQSVTLTNTGNATLSITSVTISGAQAGDFAQTNTCGGSVAAGANCSFSVSFTPGATGSRTAALTLSDNAPDSPQSVPLSGTGTAPAVSLSPGSLSFGNQAVGTTSSAQSVTLTNTGNATLSISSVTISGAQAGDFAQTNTCGGSVAAGANCSFSVSFTPGAAGSRTAALTLSDNAPGSPQAAALSGAGVQALASTYYVATDGNDIVFSGTLPAPNQSNTDGPFRTLQRAQQAVQAAKGHAIGPITVEVRSGTYYMSAPLSMTYIDGGNAQQPITWEGYPGDPQPLISGGQPLTGWQAGAGDLWTLQLPASFQNFEALYVNGVRHYRTQTSSGYLTLNPVILSAPVTNCTEPYGTGYRCSDRFSFNPGDLPASFHDLTDVELVAFEDWTVARMRLQSIDIGQNVAYLTGPMNSGQFSGFLAGHRYLVQNAQEYLNQPGEWYLDRSTSPWTLEYLAMPEEDPNTEEVIAPQQSQLLVAHQLQYVTFQNLSFAHDNYTVPPQGHPGSSGETSSTAALSFNQCSNISLSRLTVSHTQGWAMEFIGTSTAGVGNTLSGSALYDLGAGGVRVGLIPGPNGTDATVTQYNTLINNMIYSGGRFLPGGEGTGVWIGSSHHNTISNNDVHDFYNGAIELGQSVNASTFTHDNLVEYNLLYNLGQGVTSDMGCIHVASSNNVGNQILNNVCHDVTNDPAGYGGNGIYLDSNSQNVQVQNNLVYRVSDTALYVSTGGLGHVINNNIFAFATQGMMRRGPAVPGGSFTATHNIFLYDIGPIQRVPGDWGCQGNCTSAFVLDNNIYWNTSGAVPSFVTTTIGNANKIAGTYNLSQWGSQFSEDVHSSNINPEFVNPAYPQDDYSLLPGSPSQTIAFEPFSVSAAGPQTAFTVVSVPAAFPLQLLNPLTDF